MRIFSFRVLSRKAACEWAFFFFLVTYIMPTHQTKRFEEFKKIKLFAFWWRRRVLVKTPLSRVSYDKYMEKLWKFNVEKIVFFSTYHRIFKINDTPFRQNRNQTVLAHFFFALNKISNNLRGWFQYTT